MRKECPICGQSLRWKWVHYEPHPQSYFICPHCQAKLQRIDLAAGAGRRAWWIGLWILLIPLIWLAQVRAGLALSVVGMCVLAARILRWWRERDANLWVPHAD
jgi:endogenous inhibitor of DNA gyrase (YacG/DUF329 family)